MSSQQLDSYDSCDSCMIIMVQAANFLLVHMSWIVVNILCCIFYIYIIHDVPRKLQWKHWKHLIEHLKRERKKYSELSVPAFVQGMQSAPQSDLVDSRH